MTVPVLHSVCIGLGGNLGDAQTAISRALEDLASVPGIVSVRVSGFYRSRAWGRTDQPDFINACAMLTTTLEPLALLDVLQEIEGRHGRVRTADGHWGPRTLDLDVLLYGDLVIDHPRLQVPHPWMQERAFVLVPLAELCAQTVIPGRGSVAEALLSIDTGEVERIGG